MKRIMTAHSDHGLETSYLEKAGENNSNTVSISPAHSTNHILFSLKMVRINNLNFLICRYFAPAYLHKNNNPTLRILLIL